ncbi:MAG: glycosyl hydrolase, partial [Deltaproteobacteria bacterium]
NQHGVGLYAEAMGTDAPTTGDGLLNKGMVDIPMGEFWTPRAGTEDGAAHNADLKEAASAAHIYGKKIVAAESFTTMPGAPVWASPYYMKQVGDHALASGINRIVFHTSDQQPFVDGKRKPGMTLGPFGQHYTRNNTWADQAIAWNTYISRCSELLQQGSFVGDLAYFYGEGAPVTVPSWKATTPAPPDGYDYDWINADIMLHRVSVKEGRLVLPSGMSYAALVLPDYVNQMTLPMLRKIRDLVAEGAIVIAPKPQGSPSLADQDHAAEFQSIANVVWGQIDGMGGTENNYGKGRVYWGRPVAEALAAAKTPPDFEYSRPEADARLVWIHRRDGDVDIYFVANQIRRAEDLTASFRFEGREAELWHPDSGDISPASYSSADGRTTVPLHFDPLGSVFVVFRKKAVPSSRTLPHPEVKELAKFSGSWQVSFPPDLGAPPAINLDKLISWTDSSEEGVKYFSGTATYSKDVQVSAAWLRSGAKLMLDLGDVEVIAQVSVNRKPLDEILWKPPYRIDVTRALKSGTNHIEIRVTNLWPNRVIGDQQPNAKQRYAWLDYRPYRADTPLLESGLLGPVRILSVSTDRR